MQGMTEGSEIERCGELELYGVFNNIHTLALLSGEDGGDKSEAV